MSGPAKKSRAQGRIEKLLADPSPLKRRFIWKTVKPAPRSVADICREINRLARYQDVAEITDQGDQVHAATHALKWAIGLETKPPRETFEP